MKARANPGGAMADEPYDKEWWDSLPPDYRAELEQAIAEADAGEEGIPHEEVMAWFMGELERRLAKRHGEG